jgi:hypothetical protein
MGKNTCGYIPLPFPKTTKKKWCMYINLDDVLEMILFDGTTCYTPDFPNIPIERIDLADDRYITQESLSRVCSKIMKEMEVVYNKRHKIWEALPKDDSFFPF